MASAWGYRGHLASGVMFAWAVSPASDSFGTWSSPPSCCAVYPAISSHGSLWDFVLYSGICTEGFSSETPLCDPS